MAWNPNVPTVTNRVQDDLGAIRQNFEALDGLPQGKTNILELAGEKDNILGHLEDTNNPHNVQAQQVPYSSGVAGFSPADVKAALDALAGVRIVEMGSNSNGEYVRWENGIQIAWLVQTNVAVSLSTTTVQGLTVYYTNRTWTFPAAFTGMPAVVIEHDAAGVVERPGNEISQPNETSVIYSVSYLVNSTSLRYVAHIAVGRWK